MFNNLVCVIVLLHGLDGREYLLPCAIPMARVLTCGYDANTHSRTTSRNNNPNVVRSCRDTTLPHLKLEAQAPSQSTCLHRNSSKAPAKSLHDCCLGDP